MSNERHSDVSDQATANEELFLEVALRAKREEGPQATGLCLNCDESLPEGHRWCDADCHRDWKLRTRNGG